MMSSYTLDGNAREILRLLDDLNAKNAELLESESAKYYVESKFEIHRLLHNFTAAAGALYDHTYRFLDKNYCSNNDCMHCKEKFEEYFKYGALANFVRQLRNYILHRELPRCSITIAFNAYKPESTAYSALDVSELLKWDGWNQKSKNYMQSSGMKIKIHEFTKAYRVTVREFYFWLQSELNEHHEQDLITVAKLRQELDKYYPGRPQSNDEIKVNRT